MSLQTLIADNNREIVFKLAELFGYRYASRGHGTSGLVTEPIRQFTDQVRNLTAVRPLLPFRSALARVSALRLTVGKRVSDAAWPRRLSVPCRRNPLNFR